MKRTAARPQAPAQFHVDPGTLLKSLTNQMRYDTIWNVFKWRIWACCGFLSNIRANFYDAIILTAT